MRVYIAELRHTRQLASPLSYAPLAAGVLAAYLKRYCPNVEVEIFDDPDKLLDTVERRPPDVVGFTFRMWADKLAKFCASLIKEKFPHVLTVAGGPSIDDIDGELRDFLQRYPFIDVCVPNKGEIAFLRLVEHLIENDGCLDRERPIVGCCTLNSAGQLVRGSFEIPDLADTPSAYLDGILDPYLEAGNLVLLETSRGCPYLCKFCTNGSTFDSKINVVPLERVKAEFDYICRRAKASRMMLADLNFGILGERDEQVARIIHESIKAGGFPYRFDYYPFKKLTKPMKSIAKMFGKITDLTISFQTFQPDAIQAFNRYNIEYDDFAKLLAWSRKNDVRGATEMIFGFPGETADTFISALEKLMRSGIDNLFMYNMKILDGADIGVPETRKQFRLQSMFRRIDQNYGTYRGVPIIETEEVVVAANTFDKDDFIKVRKYGLFLELTYARGYLS